MTEMCSTCSSGQAGARDTIIKDDVENWFRHKETWGIKECKTSSCRKNEFYGHLGFLRVILTLYNSCLMSSF